MKVDTSGGKIIVESPYHPVFVDEAPTIGGVWDRERHVWVFDERELEAVEKLCLKVYGTASGAPEDYCEVEFNVDNQLYEVKGPVRVCGVQIASARGRDTGAKLAYGVTQISGDRRPTSSGSRENWETVVFPGRYRIAKFPALFIEKLQNSGRFSDVVAS